MKKWMSSLLIAFLLSFLVACGAADDAEDGSQNTDSSTGEAAIEESGGDSFPLTITDAVGNELTLEEEPERIISIIPSNTEIVFALDKGDKIVGVTENDNYPEEVTEIDKVGDMNLNVEVIIGLDSDIVLAHESGYSYAQEAFQQLDESGVDVFVVDDAQDIETTYETIETIGQVIGAADEAEQLVAEMKEEIAELEEITSGVDEENRQTVLFENSPSPDIYIAGKNTFLDELLQVIHADNAAEEVDGWAAIDPESIIEMNPDVIVTTYGAYVEDAFEEVTSRDGFEVVDAVGNERVYDLDADMLTRPGPRIVDGARELAEAVYPELFDEE